MLGHVHRIECVGISIIALPCCIEPTALDIGLVVVDISVSIWIAEYNGGRVYTDSLSYIKISSTLAVWMSLGK